MTKSTGNELLSAMQELRSLFPDWCMGQLVAILTQAAGRDRDGAIWDVEDEELLTAARRVNGFRSMSGLRARFTRLVSHAGVEMGKNLRGRQDVPVNRHFIQLPDQEAFEILRAKTHRGVALNRVDVEVTVAVTRAW
jgi:hypothetical protein